MAPRSFAAPLKLGAEPNTIGAVTRRTQPAHEIAPISEAELLRGYARRIGVRDPQAAADRTGEGLYRILAEHMHRATECENETKPSR
jgi:hypothetical protein